LKLVAQVGANRAAISKIQTAAGIGSQ
jgi:hypothetical protein